MEKELELVWLGVPVTVIGDYTRPRKATEIDPPEAAEFDIEQVLAGGVDILPILECVKAMRGAVNVDAVGLLQENCLVQLEYEE